MFVATPLVVGLVAGGHLVPASIDLVVATLAAFLLRQPLTVAIKIRSKRRGRGDLPACLLWLAVWGALAVAGGLRLLTGGHGELLLLAPPALAILAWYLALVARRGERDRPGLQILGTGALALSAPAALWVARGEPDPRGWLLWALLWSQAAASILHVRQRLAQRRWPGTPPVGERLRRGAGSLLAAGGQLAGVAALGWASVVSPALTLAYAVQAAESLVGALRPAVGATPTAVGLRQLAVSLLFAVSFLLAW